MGKGGKKRAPKGATVPGVPAEGSSQLSSPELSEVTQNIGACSISSDQEKSIPFVTREEVQQREKGEKKEFEKLIDVYSNCFRIKIQNLVSPVYHYDVTITRSKHMVNGRPKEDAPRINRNINFAVMEELKHNLRSSVFKGIAAPFDGEKNMYTNKPLNDGPLNAAKQYELKVQTDKGEEEEFSVAIQLAQDGEIDMTPIKKHFDDKKPTPLDEKIVPKYVQILDVILNPIPSEDQVSFRRALFDPNHNAQDIGEGSLLVQGSKAAVRSSIGGPMLNADTTSTIFIKAGPLFDVVNEIWGRGCDTRARMPPEVHERVSQMLKHQQIEARHTSIRGASGKFRKYRVIGLSYASVSQMKFPLKKKDPKTGKEINHGEISVADYFKKEYPKCPIRALNWPCVIVGNVQNQRYLPIEACYIVKEQPLKGSISSTQQSEMTRQTAKPPHERFREIKEKMVKIKSQLKPHLDAFKIDISTDPILIKDCRVIPAPKLVYSLQNRKEVIKEAKNFNRRMNIDVVGEWRLDRNQNFYQPINLATNPPGKGLWGVINFSDIPMEDLRLKFFTPLIKQAKELYGIEMGGPPLLWRDFSQRTSDLVHSQDPAKFLEEKLDLKAVVPPNLKLLFVILPTSYQRRGGTDIYPDVKFICDVFLGIPTQCVDSDKINPIPDRNGRYRSKQVDFKTGEIGVPYLGNILQKVNAKAGGVNTISQILHDTQLAKATYKGFPPNTMILGADATHPAPGDALKYSVTSIVGSLDPELKGFASRVAIQEPRPGRESKEIIEKFDDQVWDLIQEYEKVNKKKPNALVVYRDGVSEGQFEQVAKNEASKVMEMLKSKGLSIKITYIVVTKRHNFRAFQIVKQGPRTNIENIPAGTVIDKEVVSKGLYDFYLSSHIAIKGTARAAKYTVLIDQNDLKPNLLEALSFALCCICVRCMRSVSIPVPVMYADLSAYRARDHIVAILRSEPRSNDFDPDSANNQRLRAKIRNALAEMRPDYKWGFYYC